MNEPSSWASGARPNPYAALPSGWRGRLGGWLMSRTNRPQQREVLELAAVRPGEAVLEVGHGPGVMVRELASATAAGRIVAVDPSPEMSASAARRNARAIAEERVRIGAGTAADTGQPDAHFDLVLSVNTVAIWPDLETGTRELARVLRPGGRLLLSWHGGTRPSRMAAKLALDEPRLDRIGDALGEVFESVARLRTEHCEVFRAVRGG